MQAVYLSDYGRLTRPAGPLSRSIAGIRVPQVQRARAKAASEATLRQAPDEVLSNQTF